MKARLTLFNCATLTASVSAVPAATPTICRVLVAAPVAPVASVTPTDRAPKLLFNATPVRPEYLSVRAIFSVLAL